MHDLSRRRLLGTVAASTSLLGAGAATPALAPPGAGTGALLAEGRTFRLTIMQTNDLHGHLQEVVETADGRRHENNVAKYATLIDQVRAEEENVLVLDGGDLFLRGEFEQLKDYQRTLNFPILCGNVVHEDNGKLLPFAEAATAVTFAGVKVSVVGVTSMKPELREWEDVAGLDFIDPVEALEGGLLAEATQRSHMTVVLSHAGNDDDHRIAKLGGVDVVLGADTHKIIRTPETEVNAEGRIVPITQGGGEQEHYLTRLDLEFVVREGKYVLERLDGRLYEDLSGVEEDPRVVATIEKYRGMLTQR